MSFFAGCDFFMVLFILLIPAVLLGLSEKKLKWYRWLLSLFFIWEVYGSTKIQLLYLIGYVIFAAYLVKKTEQRTYPLCTGLYAGKHHQNPQHQAVHESCPFQCPVYDWQLLHVPCISRYVRRAHYPVGKKQGHTRLHLQRGRKPVNQPKGGFYDDTENRSFDF